MTSRPVAPRTTTTNQITFYICNDEMMGKLYICKFLLKFPVTDV